MLPSYSTRALQSKLSRLKAFWVSLIIIGFAWQTLESTGLRKHHSSYSAWQHKLHLLTEHAPSDGNWQKALPKKIPSTHQAHYCHFVQPLQILLSPSQLPPIFIALSLDPQYGINDIPIEGYFDALLRPPRLNFFTV